MKTLSVKELIDFRSKSPKSKVSFVERVKLNKVEPPSGSGGDYWVTSVSAVANSFKENNLSLADEKILELEDKMSGKCAPRIKIMHQRNIVNLQKYKEMEVAKLRPKTILSFVKKSTGNSVIMVRGFEVVTKATHIFLSGTKGQEKVGAIWFTATRDGYSVEEVGMFCDMLYRFLKDNYSKKYQLDEDYCIAVDIVSGRTASYSELGNGLISAILTPTLNEIQKLL